MNERARRVGLNESLFRNLNERIEDINEAFARRTGSTIFTMVCECGDVVCVERFDIPRAEYEAVRANDTRFAVIPGHDDPSVEDVVEEHGTYNVVEKRPGAAAEIARATSPRSS